MNRWILFLVVVMSTAAMGSPDTANWMESLYEHQPDHRLKDVIIPGTHNSGTDEMTSDSAKSSDLSGALRAAPRGAIKAWSKTQNHGVYQSLLHGIRYLDLRVEEDRGTWWTYHGLRSNSLTSVLDQIGRFAKSHRREIVIVDFQSMIGFPSVAPLVSYMEHHPGLGERLIPHDATDDVTFKTLWQMDRNILIMMNQATGSDMIWPRHIHNPWPNTRHSDRVMEALKNQIKIRPTRGFYVSQAIVTPDAHVITTGWLGGVKSLEDMARKWMNPEYQSFIPELNRIARTAGSSLNIVIADFYEYGDFVATCLRQNQRNLDATRAH